MILIGKLKEKGTGKETAFENITGGRGEKLN